MSRATWGPWWAVLAVVIGIAGVDPVAAQLEYNMPRGVTAVSENVYQLHMLMFAICCVLAVVVFGVMIYSIIRFRHSRGAVPATFHESTMVEIAWTVVPFAILISIAIPAAGTLIRMEDTSNPDMTVKVTGYQWQWHYDYLDEDVEFFSRLDEQSYLARQRDPDISPQEVENYLLNVDNPLVLPVGKKVRLLMTSNDVIHSWWVPDLAVKKDAIPGFINEAWTQIEQPGVYRGQCAELCGRDHAYMPVVVVAMNEADYADWLNEQRSTASDATDQVLAAGMGPAGGAAGGEFDPAAPPPPADVAAAGEMAAEGAAGAAQDAQDASGESGQSGGDDEATLMRVGEEVYSTHCVACHRPDGSGMPPAFPSLADSEMVASDAAAHIAIVLNGKPGTAMAAFGSILDDEQLAGVITYERNSFGHDGGVVTPQDIEQAREEMQ